MYRNIHKTWLGILCFIFSLPAAGFSIENEICYGVSERNKIPSPFEKVINPLLYQDLYTLQKEVNNEHLNQFSKDQFIELFYEGIEAANSLFFQTYSSKKERRNYEKGVRSILSSYNSVAESHHVKGHHISEKIHPPMKKWTPYGKAIFEPFSGKWYGNWRSAQIDHLWLPTHELPLTFSFENMGIAILAFQSVYTGDGIGWNYLLQKDGMKFILGFVGHFDEAGSISMKRPHIGFPQANGAIIWKTRDHMYLEFVCQHHACEIAAEHYVITGISYKTGKRKLKTIEAFQAIYTRDPRQRPTWRLLSKK